MHFLYNSHSSILRDAGLTQAQSKCRSQWGDRIQTLRCERLSSCVNVSRDTPVELRRHLTEPHSQTEPDPAAPTDPDTRMPRVLMCVKLEGRYRWSKSLLRKTCHCIGLWLSKSLKSFNVAFHHLLSNGCSAVNGCRQNESPNSW